MKGVGRFCSIVLLLLAEFLVLSFGQNCQDREATCSGCTRPAQCFIDPCKVVKCPAYPEAECFVDYCQGCEAQFFDKFDGNVTSNCYNFQACSRKGGSDMSVECGRYNKDICPENSYCDIDPLGRFATCCCDTKVAPCPGCSPPSRCSADPCDGAVCGNFPTAVCRPSQCGECKAQFFYREMDVTDLCSKEYGPCERYGGVSLNISCKFENESCPVGAYCDNNFGECCCPQVECGVDPCSFRSCPTYPGATCRQACGSCDAHFNDEFGNDVTNGCYDFTPCKKYGGRRLNTRCQNDPERCPENSYCDLLEGGYEFYSFCCCDDSVCSSEVCSEASCPAFPSAFCLADGCDSCKARFFHDGIEVTSLCCNGEDFEFRNSICYERSCLRNECRRCRNIHRNRVLFRECVRR